MTLLTIKSKNLSGGVGNNLYPSRNVQLLHLKSTFVNVMNIDKQTQTLNNPYHGINKIPLP